jgi:hypothetical protein
LTADRHEDKSDSKTYDCDCLMDAVLEERKKAITHLPSYLFQADRT